MAKKKRQTKKYSIHDTAVLFFHVAAVMVVFYFFIVLTRRAVTANGTRKFLKPPFLRQGGNLAMRYRVPGMALGQPLKDVFKRALRPYRDGGARV